MTFLVNIIGAGHVGKTIGHLLAKHAQFSIGGICNQSEASAISAIQFIGQGVYCPTIVDLPPADITFITTPDSLISTTCEALSKNKLIKKDSLVLHCSGGLSSDALISVKAIGCYTASVHPMRSFAKPESSVAAYHGTYCAIEGDEEALPKAHFIFNAIGSITYNIDKTKKSSYHAAGVFASNYLVTLAQLALSCMNEADVEHEMAMHVITNIMQGTVSNLETTLSPAKSLTGPIKRGDTSTIMNHINALTDIEQKHLYSLLGKATVDLTEHNALIKNEIIKALDPADKPRDVGT